MFVYPISTYDAFLDVYCITNNERGICWRPWSCGILKVELCSGKGKQEILTFSFESWWKRETFDIIEMLHFCIILMIQILFGVWKTGSVGVAVSRGFPTPCYSQRHQGNRPCYSWMSMLLSWSGELRWSCLTGLLVLLVLVHQSYSLVDHLHFLVRFR